MPVQACNMFTTLARGRKTCGIHVKKAFTAQLNKEQSSFFHALMVSGCYYIHLWDRLRYHLPDAFLDNLDFLCGRTLEHSLLSIFSSIQTPLKYLHFNTVFPFFLFVPYLLHSLHFVVHPPINPTILPSCPWIFQILNLKLDI